MQRCNKLAVFAVALTLSHFGVQGHNLRRAFAQAQIARIGISRVVQSCTIMRPLYGYSAYLPFWLQ